MEAGLAASHFPSATLLGGPGSVAELRRRAMDGRLEDYDVIHFAAHTLTDRAPERGGLVLGAGHPSPDDGGILEVEDVLMGWHIRARLVTLSACESARVAGMSRSEDIAFTPALLAAGADSVLASLWAVDDRATTLLMDRFYANLAGSGGVRSGSGLDADRAGVGACWNERGSARPRTSASIRRGPLSAAAALRDAKLFVRDYATATGERPYAHPAYWAGFLLVGAPERREPHGVMPVQ